MKIFNVEKKLGLSDTIATANKTEACLSLSTKSEEAIVKAKKLRSAQENEYEKEFLSRDLMKFSAILVTTTMNKNDDFFHTEDTSKAKYSPVFKPVNLEHRGKEGDNQVLGVIASSMCVDDNLEYVYSEDGIDKFHLLVEAYLWEKYFPNTVAKIKENIDKNELFVSMEAYFGDFGYALHRLDEPNGEIMLLERNEITAVLSENLRALGGSGEVNINGVDYKIGRWLRDFVFSGMGIVATPANEESIIFEDYLSHASTVNKLSSDAFQEKFGSKLDNGVFLHSKGKIQLWH